MIRTSVKVRGRRAGLLAAILLSTLLPRVADTAQAPADQGLIDAPAGQAPSPDRSSAERLLELERNVRQLESEFGLREEVARLRKELADRRGASATLDVPALVGALAWPLALVLVLLVFRERLVTAAQILAPRVKALSIGVVSFEFAEARPLSLQMTGAVDLRHAGESGDVNDSTLRSFYDQISDPSRLDYAVVDLGEGREWLSSRLFILSVILARMRGLRALVFVETAGHVRRRFVGVSECEKVRWRLAMRFPWLEAALAHAEAAVWPTPVAPFDPHPGGPNISNEQGRLEDLAGNPEPAAELLRAFLDAIQHPHAGAAVPPDWETLPTRIPPKIEHAQWLTPSDLEKIIGRALDQTSVDLTALQGSDDLTKARIFASQTCRWVGVTRDERVFDRLVDRSNVVETVARNCVQARSS